MYTYCGDVHFVLFPDFQPLTPLCVFENPLFLSWWEGTLGSGRLEETFSRDSYSRAEDLTKEKQLEILGWGIQSGWSTFGGFPVA